MIETLFFHTYYSYLLGDVEKTRMYYELLKEEFNERGNRNALDTYQLKELKTVRDALSTGIIATDQWVTEIQAPDPADKNDLPKQNDLVKRLHMDAVESLKSCVGSNDSFELYNIEHPCNPYGRVDMVYRDSECMYPVEIKRNEGKHDIIGQIAKYTLYFKMHLHLKMYKRVQPVTICRGYDSHVLSELKRMSVDTLRYTVVNGKIIIGKL
jgi:hypothetical protein